MELLEREHANKKTPGYLPQVLLFNFVKFDIVNHQLRKKNKGK